MHGNPRRGVLENFGYVGLASLSGSALALVATAHIARRLGVDAFGTLNYSRTIVEYCALPVAFGLGSIGTRSLAIAPAEAHQTFLHTQVLRWAAASIGLVCLLTLTLFIDFESYGALLLVLAPTIPLTAANIAWMYAGLENQSRVAWSTLVGRLVYVALVLAFVRGPGDAIAVAAVLVVELAVVAGIQWVRRPQLRGATGSPTAVRVPDLVLQLRESVPVGLSVLGQRLKTSADMVMLGLMAPVAQVGYYSSGYRLVLFVNTMSALYSGVLLPRIARTAVNRPEADRVVSLNLKYTATLAGLVAVMGSSLANPITTLLFGAAYGPAAPVLSILMVGAGLIVVSMSLGNSAIAVGRSRQYAGLLMTTALANVVANAVAIPLAGMHGAAITTLLTEVLLLVGVLRVMWDRGVREALALGFLVRLGLVCGVTAGAVHAAMRVATGPLLPALIGCLVYVGGALLLRIIRLGDVRMLMGQMRELMGYRK